MRSTRVTSASIASETEACACKSNQENSHVHMRVFAGPQTLIIIVAHEDHLVGLVVKTSASRAEGPGFDSRLRRDFFRGRVIPVTSKLALQWLPCQANGVLGSVLGLVGLVSVYCDWVRWKV